MTRDSTPHRVFKISELTGLVANHLVLTSRKSAANLARTCKCIEEPVLSMLWQTQQSLYILLRVLPGGTWCLGGAGWDHMVRGLGLLLDKSNSPS